MKFVCQQGELARGLSTVGRAVSRRSVLPILQNVLMVADDGGWLRLIATDLELSIDCLVDADVEEEGSFTVPAKILSDFVNSLPGGKTHFKLVEKTQALNVNCGAYEANIKGLAAEEFPQLKRADTDSVVVESFRQIIDQTAFAASKNLARPVLTGVRVELDGERLILAAADGFRMSVASVPCEGKPTSRIVPARALNELRRIAKNPVEMQLTDNRAFFHVDGVTLATQLVEGTFPDYKEIISDSYTTNIELDTAEFAKALRMALVFARDGANQVEIEVKREGLVLSARSVESGDNVSELNADVTGDLLTVMFNARYLLDGLEVMGTDRVSLKLNSANSPGVLKPVDGADFTHVVMPMQGRDNG